MATEIKKEYIGDGVYANFDGFNIVLTAENGICATDTIYLEPSVLEALNRYAKRIEELRKTQTHE